MSRGITIFTACLVGIACLAAAVVRAQAPEAPPSAATRSTAPDIVMLGELSKEYQPVPFDHKSHAAMTEMWDGCTTCHHRSPDMTTTQPAVLHPQGQRKNQDNAARIPACKECHDPSGTSTDLRMPNLKGAYHRQCLNCHREWTGENACGACHETKNGAMAQAPPTVDDIVGRMHPPIKPPADAVYATRFTPAVGKNVLFRHEAHTANYGLRCASCHRKDTCVHCHSGGTPDAATQAALRPIQHGRTWKESHEPCITCHDQDRCAHCHYGDDEPPPPVFEHRITGQLLDDDHASLKCGQCHTDLKNREGLTCGGAACHEKEPSITFTTHRPGPTVTTQPAVIQVAVSEPAPATPATQPTTRAVIRRIRR